MRLRHPSRQALSRWLESADDGPVDDDVDAHVATCDRCANRLDDLARPLPDLGSALLDRLPTPDGLAGRLGSRMTDSLRRREDMALFIELLGVPLATVRTLSEEET